MGSWRATFFIVFTWLLFCEIKSGTLHNAQTNGEQMDLLGLNFSDLSRWTESTNFETDLSSDVFDDNLSMRKPQVQPFDEVERIEPSQWSGRGEPVPTRNTSPDSSLPLPPKRLPNYPTTLAQRNPTTQRYPTVTAPPQIATAEEVFCDFGPLPANSLCEWQDGEGDLKWTAGTGGGTNWLGGPSMDATSSSMEGGYAFLETSHISHKDLKPRIPGGSLHSPMLGSTGSTGSCFQFKYAMDGLSVAGLRLILHRGLDDYSFKKENPDETAVLDNGTATVPSVVCDKPPAPAEERVIWNAQYFNLGVWQQAQILYTFPDVHSLVIEGIPVDVTDPSRLYRGYIAIDDIDLQPGSSCVGFCNFAADFCDWSNDAEDDFDWTISRGSSDPTTGPTTDSSTDRSVAGGYAYIDSRFPRRPGDVARLISTNFPATGPDSPMCLNFWFHMFGSGIGSLRLYLRHFRDLEGQLQVIWELSGNAGNSWFASEVTISSLDDYQLIFEASVGITAMGDIALDDIMFTHGPCPISPQVAAPSRDCTFENDECEWINSRDPDRVDWERLSTQVLSPRHQRKHYTTAPAISRRNDYFLNLAKPRGGPRAGGGGTAQLISREMKGSAEPLCITFWYFMFESFIDSTGPSLGILRVLVQPIDDSSTRSIPVWQLYNNQGPTWNFAQAPINEERDFSVILEGTWGPNRASGSVAVDDITFFTGNCSVRPLSALVKPYDCSFEKDLCGWENMTATGTDRTVTWQRAFQAHRPAQLLDKTFGATGDFIFFDIFTTNQKSINVQLRSPLITPSPEETATCFTFWFAAFGVEESTMLRVVKISTESDGIGNVNTSGDEEEGANEPLWSLTAKGFNNIKPVWTAAQVSTEAQSPFYLVLEGSASNGGFAIDDIKFQSQACQTRPLSAQPVSNTI